MNKFRLFWGLLSVWLVGSLVYSLYVPSIHVKKHLFELVQQESSAGAMRANAFLKPSRIEAFFVPFVWGHYEVEGPYELHFKVIGQKRNYQRIQINSIQINTDKGSDFLNFAQSSPKILRLKNIVPDKDGNARAYARDYFTSPELARHDLNEIKVELQGSLLPDKTPIRLRATWRRDNSDETKNLSRFIREDLFP